MIPRIHSNLSPLWGWDPGLLFTPGLRPGLHSYAASRLERANCNSFTPSGARGLHSVAAPRLGQLLKGLEPRNHVMVNINASGSPTGSLAHHTGSSILHHGFLSGLSGNSGSERGLKPATTSGTKAVFPKCSRGL